MYGIDTSIRVFNEQNVLCAGVHGSDRSAVDPKDSVTWIEVNGIKIAVLAYTDTLNGMALPKEHPYAVETFKDEKRVVESLEYARARADAVIVYVHWGDEYADVANERQRYLAGVLSKHGADAVIGCHPHVIQEIEQIDETIVYYSLGNFLSGQDREGCKEGLLAKLTICKKANGEVIIL